MQELLAGGGPLRQAHLLVPLTRDHDQVYQIQNLMTNCELQNLVLLDLVHIEIHIYLCVNLCK